MAEYGRQLHAHVPIGHIGRAHPAGEHVADDLARRRDGVGDFLDPHLIERDRAGYLHGPTSSVRTVVPWPGRATSRSVTSAVIVVAGATRTGGLREGVSGMESSAEAARRCSAGSLFSV